MCLAGACGLWDTGFGAGLDPPRVIMHGVRELEGGERVAPRWVFKPVSISTVSIKSVSIKSVRIKPVSIHAGEYSRR